MTNTFIQIHTLTGFSGVLLNRDDSGLAKRLEYGGKVRTRTSSQFAKRKLRTIEGDLALESLGGISVRSRNIFRGKIAEPLIAEGLDVESVIAATTIIMDALYKPSDKAKKAREKSLKELAEAPAIEKLAILERDELIILGHGEIEFIKDIVHEAVAAGAGDSKIASKEAENYIADKTRRANLKELAKSMPSIDVALFGRMVTGDILSAMDAAIHVGHAITVHTQESEIDYFTAVDDLNPNDGAAHVGETEITSPLLYGYYVVDMNQLLKNLAGLDNAKEVAARIVSNLIRAVSTEIVGAKKGSTAPYSTADFVLVEVGNGANRTLAESFRKPVKSTVEAAVSALEGYVNSKDAMLGQSNERWVASIVETNINGAKAASLPVISSEIEGRLAV